MNGCGSAHQAHHTFPAKSLHSIATFFRLSSSRFCFLIPPVFCVFGALTLLSAHRTFSVDTSHIPWCGYVCDISVLQIISVSVSSWFQIKMYRRRERIFLFAFSGKWQTAPAHTQANRIFVFGFLSRFATNAYVPHTHTYHRIRYSVRVDG